MTVWAETQGRRVNSFAFTWPAFHSCLSQGAGRQRHPAPPATQTCSLGGSQTPWSRSSLSHQPRGLDFKRSLFATKARPPWKGLHVGKVRQE